MKAGDVKCPECGGPPVDVNPDVDLGPAGALFGVAEVWTSCTCAQGHRFCVHVQGGRSEILRESQRGRDLETGELLP